MRGRWICLQSQFLGYATVVNLNCTKRFLFDLKCTKIAGGWGSAPDPTGGSLQRSPRPPSCYRGKGGEGGRGRGGDFAILPPISTSWLRHWQMHPLCAWCGIVYIRPASRASGCLEIIARSIFRRRVIFFPDFDYSEKNNFIEFYKIQNRRRFKKKTILRDSKLYSVCWADEALKKMKRCTIYRTDRWKGVTI